jgi:hypothetical protein
VCEEIDAMITDLEERQARPRCQAQEQESVELHCAKYILAEAKALQANYIAPTSEPNRGNCKKSIGPRQHPINLFHNTRCQRDGLPIQSWAGTWAEWGAMSPDEQADWAIAAELANSGASTAALCPQSRGGDTLALVPEEDGDQNDAEDAASCPFNEQALIPALSQEIKQEWSGTYALDAATVEAAGNSETLAASFDERVRAVMPLNGDYVAKKEPRSVAKTLGHASWNGKLAAGIL